MSKRTRKKGEEISENIKSSGAQEVVSSDAELKDVFDNLRAQIEGINSKLENISYKIRPTDLKSVEDKMASTLDKVNEVNNSLAGIEKELHALLTYAFVFNVVGVAGVLIVLLYALRALRVI